MYFISVRDYGTAIATGMHEVNHYNFNETPLQEQQTLLREATLRRVAIQDRDEFLEFWARNGACMFGAPSDTPRGRVLEYRNSQLEPDWPVTLDAIRNGLGVECGMNLSPKGEILIYGSYKPQHVVKEKICYNARYNLIEMSIVDGFSDVNVCTVELASLEDWLVVCRTGLEIK